MNLNCNYVTMYGTKIRKEDRGKILPDIILEFVIAMKIHNLTNKPH